MKQTHLINGFKNQKSERASDLPKRELLFDNKNSLKPELILAWKRQKVA
jgi:hypothetical protein